MWVFECQLSLGWNFAKWVLVRAWDGCEQSSGRLSGNAGSRARGPTSSKVVAGVGLSIASVAADEGQAKGATEDARRDEGVSAPGAVADNRAGAANSIDNQKVVAKVGIVGVALGEGWRLQ